MTLGYQKNFRAKAHRVRLWKGRTSLGSGAEAGPGIVQDMVWMVAWCVVQGGLCVRCVLWALRARVSGGCSGPSSSGGAVAGPERVRGRLQF